MNSGSAGGLFDAQAVDASGDFRALRPVSKPGGELPGNEGPVR